MSKFSDFYTAWWFLMKHPIYVPDPGHTFEPSELIVNALFDEDAPPRPWRGIYAYPIFPHRGTLDIFVAKVNPATGSVDNNKELNTKMEVWLESGAWGREAELGDDWKHYKDKQPPGCCTHDYRLDTGGATFEEAVISLANNVYQIYGEDGIEIGEVEVS